jgi:hypothetical protein
MCIEGYHQSLYEEGERDLSPFARAMTETRRRISPDLAIPCNSNPESDCNIEKAESQTRDDMRWLGNNPWVLGRCRG